MKISPPILIRCKGNRLNVYPIRNEKTLTIAYFEESIMYLSDYEPIAIKYKAEQKKSIMTFAKFSDETVRNKIKLRETVEYATVDRKTFDDAVNDLLAEL